MRIYKVQRFGKLTVVRAYPKLLIDTGSTYTISFPRL